MHERCAAMPIADTTDNAEGNEPLVKVCVVNVDNLINREGQTTLQKKRSMVRC